MIAGEKTKTGSMMMTFKARLNLKFKIIVAVLVGFLMVAPLTRAYKINGYEPAIQAERYKPRPLNF